MFDKVVLPVVKRVFPKLVAADLISAEPMSGPHGSATFLKYMKYEAPTQNDYEDYSEITEQVAGVNEE